MFKKNLKKWLSFLTRWYYKVAKPDANFELRKDINTPNGYIRAGTRKTKAQWEVLFPESFTWGDHYEWFIDCSKPVTEPYERSVEEQIVHDVFQSRGLQSISYKEAAIGCIDQYKRYLKDRR